MSTIDYSVIAKDRIAYLEALGVARFEPRGFYIVGDPVLRLRALKDIPPISAISHSDPAVIDLVMEGYVAYLPMIEFRWFVCGAAAATTFVDPLDKEYVRTMLMLLTEALLDDFAKDGEPPKFPALAAHLRPAVETSFSRAIESVEPSVWHQVLAYIDGFWWILSHTLPATKTGTKALARAEDFMRQVMDYGILPS